MEQKHELFGDKMVRENAELTEQRDELLEALSKAAPFICKCIDENNNAGTLYDKIQDLLELQAKAERSNQ